MQSHPPVVLIVGDQQDALAMYAIGLLTMGFQPVTAGSSDVGFRRACDTHPEVIVADVRMPASSGFDLTRRLREDDRTKDSGIILLIDQASDSVMQQARDAGCDRLLLMPCLPDALALEIHDMLASRRHDLS